MAEEAQIKYKHIPVHPKESKDCVALLAVNPSGKIPALLDGDFALTESLALTTYIARRHAPQFLPKTLEGEALLLQWTLFAATEIEPPLIAYLHAQGIPFGQVDKNKAASELQILQRAFSYIDSALNSPYLLGETFSVADLNLASVLIWAKIGHVDLTEYPKMETWLKSCFERAAYRQLLLQAKKKL